MKPKTKRADVFEVLEPPPGGLAALRRRLDARPSRVPRLVLVAAPALALAAAILLVVLSRPRMPDLVAGARAHGGIDEVALGLSAPTEPVAVVDAKTAGIADVRTANPNVVFVWVASNP